jgi:hypothetical protein
VNGTFVGKTSKYLPLIQDFIEFWKNNIRRQDGVGGDSPNSPNSPDSSEFEIDEIRLMFNHECGYKTNITDKTIIQILTHFFPDIVKPPS